MEVVENRKSPNGPFQFRYCANEVNPVGVPLRFSKKFYLLRSALGYAYQEHSKTAVFFT